MQQNSRSLPWAWSRLPQTFVTSAYSYSKRLLDILSSSLGLMLLGLLIPFIWLANRLFAPGPLFYRQTRVGLHGRHFTILKLRSMIVMAERNGVVWTVEGDSRITGVGRFLRQTHLDELPQCWNILKGEMSLIGPRPERPEFVPMLAERIEGYTKRHVVKPGLTGWAQVNFEYGDSVKDAQIKLKYDLEYIARQSWWIDGVIILRTFGVILKGR